VHKYKKKNFRCYDVIRLLGNRNCRASTYQKEVYRPPTFYHDSKIGVLEIMTFPFLCRFFPVNRKSLTAFLFPSYLFSVKLDQRNGTGREREGVGVQAGRLQPCISISRYDINCCIINKRDTPVVIRSAHYYLYCKLQLAVQQVQQLAGRGRAALGNRVHARVKKRTDVHRLHLMPRLQPC
jgi:hypothetical protein